MRYRHSHLVPYRLAGYTVFEKQYNTGVEAMKSIDLMYQTMLAELGQRSLDAAWTADFPPEGRFTPANIKGRKYWYFDIPDGHGGTKRRYVGSADDPDIAQRVADHKRDKDDLRARRRLVNTLTREGGMIAPDAMSGDIVEALADGGLFRLRGVLIGTVAFQCYSGLLGVRLPMAAILTGDADALVGVVTGDALGGKHDLAPIRRPGRCRDRIRRAGQDGSPAAVGADDRDRLAPADLGDERDPGSVRRPGRVLTRLLRVSDPLAPCEVGVDRVDDPVSGGGLLSECDLPAVRGPGRV